MLDEEQKDYVLLHGLPVSEAAAVGPVCRCTVRRSRSCSRTAAPCCCGWCTRRWWSSWSDSGLRSTAAAWRWREKDEEFILTQKVQWQRASLSSAYNSERFTTTTILTEAWLLVLFILYRFIFYFDKQRLGWAVTQVNNMVVLSIHRLLLLIVEEVIKCW